VSWAGVKSYARHLLIAALAAFALFFPSAAFGSTLPLTVQFAEVVDIVVDSDHGHVFVTGGPGNSSIVVLDLSGHIVENITGQQGAAGMVLKASTSTLYVGLSGSSEISRISTETLSELGRFSVAPGPPPYMLASAGGRLWFSGCGNTPGFASITPMGTDLIQYEGGCTAFASSPTDPSLLVVGGIGGSPAGVSVLNVSTDPPTEEISGSPPGDVYGSGNLQDMEVTSDGLGLLVACAYPYFHQAISLTDLTRLVKYESDAYPNSVAGSPDGQFVAGGTGSAVYLFESGTSTATRTYATAVLPRGLAFSPNGRKIFAVGADASHQVVFHVLSNRLPTSLSLNTSKDWVTYGGSVQVTAHLDPLARATPTVSIYATPYGGKRTLLRRDTVDSSGNVSVTVTPKKKTIYSATFAGDETYEKAAASPRLCSSER
jgi:WD40 repeat protein